ncbi:hypothetical protein BDB01DRAFT_796000 [Pilobolus umbonatus]|nr:hypothetical protein BDB01DRAFT_796000 [Pilobolus umbonatus]
MSLSMTSKSSSNLHFQSKPMAISSITSPPLATLNLSSNSPSSSMSDSSILSPKSLSDIKLQNSLSPLLYTPYPSSNVSSVPSSPDSQDSRRMTYHQMDKPSIESPSNSFSQHRTDHSYIHQRQPTRDRYYSQNHRLSNPNFYTNPSMEHRHVYGSYSPSAVSVSPLSLQERRQRNKAASAKYRAKKNQQHGEMRSLISSLTKENELLQRQLDHVKRENRRLKATCDRLRGKMLAERMLKKFLHQGEEEAGQLTGEETKLIDDDQHQIIQALKRFDEDIDFEDDEDETNRVGEQEKQRLYEPQDKKGN